MSTVDAITLMIQFGMFILTLINVIVTIVIAILVR